jgi:hypothetical protein
MGQVDRQTDMTKLTDTSRNFVNHLTTNQLIYHVDVMVTCSESHTKHITE